MRRWKEGGQAVRAFCRAEGLRKSAFYFWRRELTRRGQRAGRGEAEGPLLQTPVIQRQPVAIACLWTRRPARLPGPRRQPPRQSPPDVEQAAVRSSARGPSTA